MTDTLLGLRQRLKVNTMEIEHLVAKHYMGELKELSPDDYVRLKNISEKLLLQWAEATNEG
jgi:demethoxyubiquinone hydroxylase (CLK1/Coq7/Cat5 family)